MAKKDNKTRIITILIILAVVLFIRQSEPASVAIMGEPEGCDADNPCRDGLVCLEFSGGSQCLSPVEALFVARGFDPD